MTETFPHRGREALQKIVDVTPEIKGLVLPEIGYLETKEFGIAKVTVAMHDDDVVVCVTGLMAGQVMARIAEVMAKHNE